MASRALAHYVVFEIDDVGRAVPVFHRRVTLAEAPGSASAELLHKARALEARGRQMVWVETRSSSGAVGYRQVVEAAAEVRGEFHGLALPEGGHEIDGVRLAAERPAFAVRVPVAEAGGVLQLSGAGEAVIELDQLERGADQLALASLVLPSSAVKAIDKASSANRADFLIMGDGYTAAQRNQFSADANRLANEFFAITPYREYRSYAKVSQLFTASAQSGADHPPYQAGCDSVDCCGDTLAQTDPRAGTFVQTAFDARFCTANIHRLLTVSPSKVLAAASASPEWDQILVLVNDPVFGGSGGFLSVGSLNALATEVMQHEVGHSFTGLADEYDTPISGTQRCSENAGSCEPNVTDRTQRGQIKWAPWIAGSTPVPTPSGGGFGTAVGAFEGARYFTTGQYRPRHNCAMRSLGVEFGEVCRQEYVLRLFRGGFGAPANGIDPIEPGSENPRPGTISAGSEPLTLSASLLQPSAGPGLSVQWRVDGQVMPGATGPSFSFEPEQAGTYQVQLWVDAATPLVHPAMAGDALVSSRTWTVRSDGVTGPLAAAFEWQGDQAGVEIGFTSTATGEPQAFAWDFGDGTAATGPNPEHVFAEPGLYPVTLTVTRDGETASLSRTVEVFATAPGACVETAESLCLQSGGRFKVEALWRDSVGATGAALVVPFASADSGLMVFFDAENWETLVKVLDGCGFNDHFWVFAAATTDVEYALRVTDTNNGLARIYRNPPGNASPAITDTFAFQTCEPGAEPGLERIELGATQPQEPSRRVSTPPGVTCIEDDETFCLNDARFEVSIAWRDFQGNTGVARQTAASSDSSGVMWFFSADNWELLVKVLDGCGINQSYWVFAAATTNVEYTLRVRDSVTGEVVEYFNPLGTASPSITDTGALAVCD
ncbi:MAG: M64 family metallopeptidase [Acidobacteriota bacterium]